MIATIPSFIVTWLAPFHVSDEDAQRLDAEAEANNASA